MNDAAKRVTFFLAVTGAFALALVLRLPAFAPSYLWLDDQWIGVLVRDASLGDLIALAPPVPLGFVLLLKSLVAVFGSSPAVLQAVPMLAGTLLVPATALLALKITESRAIATMAALFVAVDPTLVTYSARVKPFTLDALATVLIACAFVEAARHPSARTIGRVAVAAGMSLCFSYAAALSGAAFLHVAAVGALYAALSRRAADAAALLVGTLLACIVFDVAAVSLFALMLHGHTNAAVFTYWRKCYLPLGSVASTWYFLITKGLVLFDGTLPGAPPKLAAALAATGLLSLTADRRTRSVALGIAAVFATLFVASALDRYPVGGIRTDLFTHPLSALLAASAIGTLVGVLPGVMTFVRPVVAAAVSVAVIASSVPAAYPAGGDRDVVERAAATVTATDTVVIYPWSNWAVALYADWPVHLRAEPTSTNGFYAVPDRPRTLLLGEVVDGVSFRWSQAVAPAEIDELLGDTLPERVHFIATRTEDEALEYIRAAFEARGYVRASSYGHDRATLDVFERRPADGVDFIGAR